MSSKLDLFLYLSRLYPEVSQDLILAVIALANEANITDIARIAKAVENADGESVYAILFYLHCDRSGQLTPEAFYAIMRRVRGVRVSKDQVYQVYRVARQRRIEYGTYCRYILSVL